MRVHQIIVCLKQVASVCVMYLVSDARGPDSMAVLLNPLDWVCEIWRLSSQPSLYRNRSPGNELETHHSEKQRVLRVSQSVP